MNQRIFFPLKILFFVTNAILFILPFFRSSTQITFLSPGKKMNNEARRGNPINHANWRPIPHWILSNSPYAQPQVQVFPNPNTNPPIQPPPQFAIPTPTTALPTFRCPPSSAFLPPSQHHLNFPLPQPPQPSFSPPRAPSRYEAGKGKSSHKYLFPSHSFLSSVEPELVPSKIIQKSITNHRKREREKKRRDREREAYKELEETLGLESDGIC